MQYQSNPTELRELQQDELVKTLFKIKDVAVGGWRKEIPLLEYFGKKW